MKLTNISLKGFIPIPILVIIISLWIAKYAFSGLAFDSYNIVGQAFESNTFSSTTIVQIIFYPIFIITEKSILLSILLIVFLASLAFNNYYHSITQHRNFAFSATYISDLCIFMPAYFIYLILPGKEQIACLCICIIYSFSAKNSVKFGIFNILILASAISLLILVRPVAVFLVPFLILSNLQLNSNCNSFTGTNNKILLYPTKFNRSRLLLFVVTCCIAIYPFLEFTALCDSVRQIVFQTSYEIGNTSTGLINSKSLGDSSSIQLEQFIPPLLVSMLAGAPLFFSQSLSILTFFLSSLFILTNILVVYPCMTNYFLSSLKNGYSLLEISLVYLMSALALFLSSVALVFNTGTGLRYYLTFFFVHWVSLVLFKRKYIFNKVMSNVPP